MEATYNFTHALFKSMPEIAFFLSMALGYYAGKVNFGKFQLGGVAGSLLVAVLVSQFGVHIDDTVKNMLFALFIYAVGFTSGPMFFRSLGKQSLKEIVLAVVLAVTGLLTVVIMSRLFGLDKGLAAGIAAGGLTQSAIMGTAESALKAMNLGADETARLVANISVGYGVTYVFGSFGAILICVNLLEKFMGRSIRDDAIGAEAASLAGGLVVGEGQQLAVPALVGRIHLVGPAAGKKVGEFEHLFGLPPVTIERVKRGGAVMGLNSETVLEENDIILLVGQRDRVLAAAKQLGPERPGEEGMEVVIQTREIVVTNEKLHMKTFAEIREMASPEMRHGLYVVSLSRDGTNVPVNFEARLERGDVLTLYGAEQDVRRAASAVGYALMPSNKTDFVYMGLGLVAGLLIGKIVIHAWSIPITLGSGGGALLSGLLFGWYRTRHLSMGSFPEGAAQLLKDLGLAGFVVVVGLNYGQQAVHTVIAHGVSIFFIGVVVTILPLILTMLVGRYLLRYDNVAIFAGALAGTRSANPAFGEILSKAENSVPTVPFAVTYALANVFLTLLGPLVVALA